MRPVHSQVVRIMGPCISLDGDSFIHQPRKMLQEKTDFPDCIARQRHTQMMVYSFAWSRSQPRKRAKSKNLALHVPVELMKLVFIVKKVHSMDPGYWIT